MEIQQAVFQSVMACSKFCGILQREQRHAIPPVSSKLMLQNMRLSEPPKKNLPDILIRGKLNCVTTSLRKEEFCVWSCLQFFVVLLCCCFGGGGFFWGGRWEVFLLPLFFPGVCSSICSTKKQINKNLQTECQCGKYHPDCLKTDGCKKLGISLCNERCLLSLTIVKEIVQDITMYLSISLHLMKMLGEIMVSLILVEV